MKNFLISGVVDIVIIFVSYYLFKSVISGPTRHRIYEKFLSSFAKFIIYIFLGTVIITGVTALIFYKTRFIGQLNVIAPAIVSIYVGFITSTVPTRGIGDKDK
ncbi:hypothetical protein [Clostridium brassicae]|uniref:Uncharacterized protein n=1 Tax=Clostridium brassicae TaxID=2999072 RepID=A0ABT4DGT7_9CLOT|nr:hypothetical protein [Clostridium brassicae]MCY6960316.1 hypothetical protein [Clostridium brassicae]